MQGGGLCSTLQAEFLWWLLVAKWGGVPCCFFPTFVHRILFHPLTREDPTFSRGRKMMGSVKLMPGLRKIGCGMTVKKNLVLGGLWVELRRQRHQQAKGLKNQRGHKD